MKETGCFDIETAIQDMKHADEPAVAASGPMGGTINPLLPHSFEEFRKTLK